MYQELDPRRGPLSREEKGFLFIFVLIVLGLFTAEVVTDYTPQKLAIVFFMVFWVPMLVIHELGHAAMAWFLGWHVGEIVIGMGRAVKSFWLGGAYVEIRMLPLTGFVRSVPRDLKWPRLKLALIYLAGPGIEFVVALTLLVIVGSEAMFSASNDYGIIAIETCALVSTIGTVMNIIPQIARTPEGWLANDGLGFFRSFFLPIEVFESMLGWKYRPNDRRWDT